MRKTIDFNRSVYELVRISGAHGHHGGTGIFGDQEARYTPLGG